MIRDTVMPVCAFEHNGTKLCIRSSPAFPNTAVAVGSGRANITQAAECDAAMMAAAHNATMLVGCSYDMHGIASVMFDIAKYQQ